ncbi:MAG: chemotaxis protein CheA [Candidatus Riflebacteria bacterium]|nr:chemotaxis protein CheA [Candidatus Riflebacteria bacterium]
MDDFEFSEEEKAELSKIFVSEGEKILEEAETTLLSLLDPKGNSETSPDKVVNLLFRSFHSIKGSCMSLNFTSLSSMAHTTETYLSYFRDSKKEIEKIHLETILNVIDRFKELFEEIKKTNKESVTQEECETFAANLLEIIKSSEPENSPPLKLGEIMIERGIATPEAISEALAIQETRLSNSHESGKTIGSDIRVALPKLDLLINLVGELVIAEQTVTQSSDLSDLRLPNFTHATHHLRRILREIQEVSMSLRMVPISSLFRKLSRVVYDISRKTGKKLQLDIQGEDTEVDKTVIELIDDPLVHMVRNSADHGVESSEERLKSGKPEIATISLEAFYEGAEVLISVSDDGKGLSREKIISKGIAKNLIVGDGNNLSDADVFNLIFEPGFSTSESITDISGRGVGMDIVKKNIEKLKGRVFISSVSGRGTTFVIRIPLTLAIIDGMLLRVGKSLYTIPLLSIRESLKPTSDNLFIGPDKCEIVKLRKDLIPIVRLHQLFRRPGGQKRLEDGILVISQDQDKKIAIFVDEILGQQHTVIKPLPKYISGIAGVSGCTVLGDGRISMILNISQIFSLAATNN